MVRPIVGMMLRADNDRNFGNWREVMARLAVVAICSLFAATVLAGCQAGGSSPPASGATASAPTAHTKVRERDRDLADAQQRLDQLQREGEETRRALAEAREMLAQEPSAPAAPQDPVTVDQTARDDLNQRRAEIEALQAELQRRERTIAEQTEALSREREKLEQARQEIERQRSLLARQGERIAAERDRLEAKVAEGVQIAEQQANVERERQELSRQQAELAEQTAVLDRRAAELDAREAEIRSTAQQVADRQTLEDERATLARQQAEVEAERQQDEVIASLEVAAGERDAAYAQLAARVAQYESVLETKEKQIQVLVQHIETIAGLEVAPGEAAVKASRLFAGPGQYPPEEFTAYGIVAFPSRASLYTRDRHIMICYAYIATLPHAVELQVPRVEQMATVWPVSKDAVADALNRSPETDICEIAVSHYGLVLAKRALKDAKVAGVEVARSGPFLLAWSPSTDKGKEDALVLVSDLSDVTTYAQAQSMLLAWSNDIESDPTLWKNGWNVERLRIKIRHWVDNYGSRTLAIFGLENQ